MFQEVNGVGWIYPRVQSLVLNAGGTVDNVVLVGGFLPVFDVHLPNFTRLVPVVAEATLDTTFVGFGLSEPSSAQYVANAVARHGHSVVSRKYNG